MAMKVYVNLPVKDLGKTKEFFASLGFQFYAKFTDERAVSMIIGAENYVMFLAESFFQSFTKKEICDASKATEVIVALSVETREMVDELYDKAIAAGGTKAAEPQDHGFMQSQSFEDLDGHIWEVFYMDEAAMNQSKKS